EPVRGYLEGPIGIGLLVLVGLIILYVLVRLAIALGKFLTGGRGGDGDGPLKERLATYPPPPGQPGPRRLTVEGIPVRVRLIVVAPVGKEQPIRPEDVTALADGVL